MNAVKSTQLSHTWLLSPNHLKRELSSFFHHHHGPKTQVPRAKAPQKSRFSKCMSIRPMRRHSLLDPSLVETRCQPPGNQSHASLSHPRPRRLPQVAPLYSFQIFNSKSTRRYNKLCGSLRSMAHRISLLPAQDPFRSRMEGQILSKLYDMGVLNTSAKLSDIENKLTVSAFCRRRLAVFMCMSKMAETVSAVRPSHPFIVIVF